MNPVQKAKHALVLAAEDVVVVCYVELTSPDGDACSQDLENAVDFLHELHGRPCSGDYDEAFKTAAYLAHLRNPPPITWAERMLDQETP